MKCRFEWHLEEEIVAWLKAEAKRRNQYNPLSFGEWDWKTVAMVQMKLAIEDEMKKQAREQEEAEVESAKMSTSKD